MKKPTLENLFILLGWKKGQSKPSNETAQGKYCYTFWENIDNPKVKISDAQMWVVKRKEEVNQLFSNISDENEIKCEEFLQDFESELLNWRNGKPFITKRPDAKYEIEILSEGNQKIFVTYNGVTKYKII